MRWKIPRISKIWDFSKIAFHVLRAAPDYFPLVPSRSKYFLSNPIMIPLGDSAQTLILSCPTTWEDRWIKTQEKSMTHCLFGKFQLSSWSQRGPALPLPTSADRSGAQRIVYFLTITSSGEINLSVLRRTCQVSSSLQFLLNQRTLVLN